MITAGPRSADPAPFIEIVVGVSAFRSRVGNGFMFGGAASDPRKS
jgi:hypothetical protein